MKKLNKRYEKSLKSVKAQVTCPCNALGCRNCEADYNQGVRNINSALDMSKQHQTRLYN